ncbi:MAG: hypothetical protein KGL40_03150 [Rhodocyclaceae bacterium]|nr:hypothetical protein [Rhodocyclaceae bacterium]
MSKILTTLIAGLFAASAFAADVPKSVATTTDAKPVAEAPVAGRAMKKEHKAHHAHAVHHHAAASTTAAPASK